MILPQNAALAEEASSASQSTVRQADDMVNIVNFFQLKDHLHSASITPIPTHCTAAIPTPTATTAAILWATRRHGARW